MKIGDKMHWWENIPQCKVGDLVRHRTKIVSSDTKEPMLVLAVDVEKPCRAHPVQRVTVFSVTRNRTRVTIAKNLEVISASR